MFVPNKTEDLNIDLIEQIVNQIITGITINVYMSVKSTICVKNIIFGILLHVVAKTESI